MGALAKCATAVPLLFNIIHRTRLPHLCVQVEALSKHPHIVVATPGRLLDLVDDEAAPLTLSEWLSACKAAASPL